MTKYLKHKVYLTLPGTGNKQVRVPVRARPLTRELVFHRSKEDVEHGVQGECATCANAISSVRNGLCELAQFTDSRAYRNNAERKPSARYAAKTAIQKKRERGAAARAQRAGIVFAR